MQWVFTYGRYPDRPRSQPPLAAEDNLNAECVEEDLCPGQLEVVPLCGTVRRLG